MITILSMCKLLAKTPECRCKRRVKKITLFSLTLWQQQTCLSRNLCSLSSLFCCSWYWKQDRSEVNIFFICYFQYPHLLIGTIKKGSLTTKIPSDMYTYDLAEWLSASWSIKNKTRDSKSFWLGNKRAYLWVLICWLLSHVCSFSGLWKA